jgi:hypothetical protein
MTVPFLRNSAGFSFDSELLMQAVHFGFKTTEVPARTRYFEEASSISFGPSVEYGLRTLAVGLRLVLHRAELMHCHRFEP